MRIRTNANVCLLCALVAQFGISKSRNFLPQGLNPTRGEDLSGATGVPRRTVHFAGRGHFAPRGNERNEPSIPAGITVAPVRRTRKSMPERNAPTLPSRLRVPSANSPTQPPCARASDKKRSASFDGALRSIKTTPTFCSHQRSSPRLARPDWAKTAPPAGSHSQAPVGLNSSRGWPQSTPARCAAHGGHLPPPVAAIPCCRCRAAPWTANRSARYSLAAVPQDACYSCAKAHDGITLGLPRTKASTNATT